MLAIEIKRLLRDPIGLFFIVVLPAIMYIVFGATAQWGSQRVNEANIAMFTMVNMAAYGASTATSGVSSQAGVEKLLGWGRQLGLTPMTDLQFVWLKTRIAVIIAAIPVTIIFLIGFVTTADAPPAGWILSYVITLAGSVLFAVYGLIFAFLLRSESAGGAASGLVVVFGFLGNLFVPLSGFMLDLSRFTPFYGYAALARYPFADGWMYTMTGEVYQDPLWWAILNVVLWLAAFGLLATALARRGRERQ